MWNKDKPIEVFGTGQKIGKTSSLLFPDEVIKKQINNNMPKKLKYPKTDFTRTPGTKVKKVYSLKPTSAPRLEIAPGPKINVLIEGKSIFMATIKHDLKKVMLAKKHEPKYLYFIENYAKSLGYTLESY